MIESLHTVACEAVIIVDLCVYAFVLHYVPIAPTSKKLASKLGGHIAFGLSVHTSVRYASDTSYLWNHVC